MMNEKKITQAAAYIIQKSDGIMSHLKLMKILYLSDRSSMDQYGASITDDRIFSMDNGPVLSNTLNLINGYIHTELNYWESWISDKEDHQISIKRDITRSDLDELSDADIEVLSNTWAEFGSYTRWDLCNYTHKYCKEWKDPHGSSNPISHKDVFLALGKTAEEASILTEEIYSNRKIDSLFASL